MQASDGLLYGITTNGGAYLYGTIYSYNTVTGKETDVHDFSNGDTDGYYPQFSGLIQVGDSLLYGTTVDGGTDSVGTIFSYNIFTHKETDIYNFVSGRGLGTGSNPVTSLIQASDGLLYGATESGGVNDVGVLLVTISLHTVILIYMILAAASLMRMVPARLCRQAIVCFMDWLKEVVLITGV